MSPCGVQPRVSVRFSEELDRADGLRGSARGAMHTSGAAGVYTHARYLGMGIFTANASFDFSQHADGKTFGWQARRLGYLTEQMFGYALPRLAVMRGEPRPEWGKYLDTNPRAYLSQAARYLAGTGSG